MEPARAANDAILEAELRGLDRTLRGLPESAMQRERLLERLEAATPAEAYALVAAVMQRPGDPAPHLPHLREILQDLLREGGASRSCAATAQSPRCATPARRFPATWPRSRSACGAPWPGA